MDPPKKCCSGDPLGDATFKSKLAFSWVDSLFSKAEGEKLSLEDLNHAPPTEEISTLGQQLTKEWEKEKERHRADRKACLPRAIARAYGRQYLFTITLILVTDACRFLQPVLFRYLIEYFSADSDTSLQTALLLAAGVSLTMILQGVLGPHSVLAVVRCGMRWQGGTADLLYRKLLVLSQKKLSELTTGHVLELMNNDVERLNSCVWTLHTVWKVPLHTVLCTLLVYSELGASVFSGLGLVFLLVPVQIAAVWFISGYGKRTTKYQGERVGMMSEIIGGMRVIKMYCWEKPFGTNVDAFRNTELKLRRRVHAMWTMLREMNAFNRRLLPVAVVVMYVAMDGALSAAKVFPMISIFNILSDTLLGELPLSIKSFLEVGHCAKRIEEFLVLPENVKKEKRTPSHLEAASETSPKKEPSVRVTNLTASWNNEKSVKEENCTNLIERFARWCESQGEMNGGKKKKIDTSNENNKELTRSSTLQNVSFEISGNKLLAIVGKVGSGKSSLLMSLLKELQPNSGQVEVEGSVSYSAQQPWVFTSTIRQNILFGRAYDPDRYAKVIEAAALTTDLSQAPHADLSLVGEKGVTLSVGQKARLSLARALYAGADIVLLDDPLSAVDAHVGRHLYDRCINGFLRDKMRILVTHQTQYLKNADKVIVLQDGKVAAFGSYQEVLATGLGLGHLTETNSEKDVEATPDAVHEKSDINALKEQLCLTVKPRAKEEDRVHGSIGWRVYLEYFKSSGNFVFISGVFLMNFLVQAFSNVSDLFLSVWSSTNKDEDGVCSNTTIPTSSWLELSMDTNTSVAIYLTVLAFTMVASFVAKMTFFHLRMTACRNLHNRMYTAVVRSPVRFYDTNPKGCILNRFSGDCRALDSHIPHYVIELILLVFMMLSNLFLVVTFNPMTLLPVAPLVYAIYRIRNKYVWVHREVKRATAEANSPMLTHLNATLEGLQTIRAFGVEDVCVRDFHGHYNVKYSGWFADLGIAAWFQLRNNIVAAAFNATAVFILVLFSQSMSPGQAALTLSYILPMTYNVERIVYTSAQLELQMVKAERVIRYTKLEPEAALTSEHPPPEDWPQRGGIVFDGVSFSYGGDNTMALKHLDIEIPPGSKIGIVGRTVAGKSTIIQALFRLYESQGDIRIDGLSINKLGVHELRTKLAIIPQDPVLFKGTVRKNLDPFGAHTDAELWSVLEEVQLRGEVEEEGLDGEVTEGGGNFSVGQKQLMCLARAILRNNKVLVIDEATANVDNNTDSMIQAAIRRKFASCTVITIAHRLNTIMDSDKILVMDKGEAAEFDSPSRLLQNPDSHFYKLVACTGFVDLQVQAKLDQNPDYTDSDASAELYREELAEPDDVLLDMVLHFPDQSETGSDVRHRFTKPTFQRAHSHEV